MAKRRRTGGPAEPDVYETLQPEGVPEYQHLTAVTRRVSRQTIDAKWEPLPAGCIELISQFLQDLQRPVIVRLINERKRVQAGAALQMISRRVISKITKGLPFPAARSSREDDFIFEKILDHNRALEAQLTPSLHANELLEAELRKENLLLNSEQSALAELEINARTEAAMRKQAGRKLHVLFQAEDPIITGDSLKDLVGLGNDRVPVPLSIDVRISSHGHITITNFL